MFSTTTADGNDLIISRRIAAPPQVVWDALTDGAKLQKWFAPRPWRVTQAIVEPQPGGRFDIRMQGPDGEAEDCASDPTQGGCVLLAEPPRRIIWTDALSGGWRPNAVPFMTAIITLDPDGDGTVYTARVLHKSAEDRQKHEEMGFAEGWGAVIEQLAELVE